MVFNRNVWDAVCVPDDKTGLDNRGVLMKKLITKLIGPDWWSIFAITLGAYLALC